MFTKSYLLELAIPTFNRSEKLNRLLTIIENEIESLPKNISIKITVSDNHSSDETQTVLQHHSISKNINVLRNNINIGGPKNIWNLFKASRAEYIWIISDDDIPKPGSLKIIIDILLNYKPTVLTFEFEQPPGSLLKRHGDKYGVEEIKDLKEAIPHVLHFGKITKQIIRTTQIKTALNNLESIKHTGYGWLIVILEVIMLTISPKIIVYHDFLAFCDDDYLEVKDGLAAQYWNDYLLLLDHDIVKRNCPTFVQNYRKGHNGYMVKIIYATLANPLNSSVLKKKILQNGKIIPFQISYFRNPFVFIEWVSLKMGIPAFRIVTKLTDFTSSAKKSYHDKLFKYLG